MAINRRKTIFFLPARAGGAERMGITIAKMLDTELFDVKFVLVCNEVESIINFIPENYEVIHLRVHNIWDFTVLRIAKLVRKEKPDAVYGCMCYLNTHVIFGTKLAFTKSKIIVRNDNQSSYFGAFKQFLMRISYPFADTIIAQQDEMKQDIVSNLRVDKQKVVVLQNPIDIQSIKEKSTDASPYAKTDTNIKYVQVGRISKDKGQDVLLKAFKIVHDRNSNTRLDIIGLYSEQDSYYQEQIEYIKSQKLDDCVRLVGFDNNPYRWIKNADCFILTSRKEGLPNALIEAMYIGTPVVATTCIPIIARIVLHNYNGILVEVDDVDGIAKAMKDALNLKDYCFTYKPATKQDFVNLFM